MVGHVVEGCPKSRLFPGSSIVRLGRNEYHVSGRWSAAGVTCNRRKHFYAEEHEESVKLSAAMLLLIYLGSPRGRLS